MTIGSHQRSVGASRRRYFQGRPRMRPDLSPAMLKSFLRIRVDHMARIAMYCEPRRDAQRAEKVALRKAARVTACEFEMAWTGRLMSPAPRERLWGALGVSPSALGLRLVHGGQEAAGADGPDAAGGGDAS